MRLEILARRSFVICMPVMCTLFLLYRHSLRQTLVRSFSSSPTRWRRKITTYIALLSICTRAWRSRSAILRARWAQTPPALRPSHHRCPKLPPSTAWCSLGGTAVALTTRTMPALPSLRGRQVGKRQPRQPCPLHSNLEAEKLGGTRQRHQCPGSKGQPPRDHLLMSQRPPPCREG